MTYDPFPYAAPHGLQGNSIEAGNDTLLRQAPMTADEFMKSAIDCIDARLGKGYAIQHPELVGAFMQASAIDLGTAVIARAIEALASASKESADTIAAGMMMIEIGST
jgi:hypothetical protein